MDETYAQAFVEVDAILDNISINLLKKVPTKFRNFIKSSKSKEYNFEYDKTLPLTEQKIKPQTRTIISLMYRNFWCTPEEKERLKQEEREELNRIEKAKAERYNPDNMFKQKEKPKVIQENIVQEQAMIVVEEEGFFRRIINKIKNWFNK